LEIEKIIKVTIIIILLPSWTKFEFHLLEIISWYLYQWTNTY